MSSLFSVHAPSSKDFASECKNCFPTLDQPQTCDQHPTLIFAKTTPYWKRNVPQLPPLTLLNENDPTTVPYFRIQTWDIQGITYVVGSWFKTEADGLAYKPLYTAVVLQKWMEQIISDRNLRLPHKTTKTLLKNYSVYQDMSVVMNMKYRQECISNGEHQQAFHELFQSKTLIFYDTGISDVQIAMDHLSLKFRESILELEELVYDPKPYEEIKTSQERAQEEYDNYSTSLRYKNTWKVGKVNDLYELKSQLYQEYQTYPLDHKKIEKLITTLTSQVALVMEHGQVRIFVYAKDYTLEDGSTCYCNDHNCGCNCSVHAHLPICFSRVGQIEKVCNHKRELTEENVECEHKHKFQLTQMWVPWIGISY